ncbi:MAG: ChbG/HpnK family deacetylase, partial [Proteobacteria bacterium]
MPRAGVRGGEGSPDLPHRRRRRARPSEVTIPILLCADDFGYADAVDAGIVDLIERGRLTATSCLVASPRWAAASAHARRLKARADFGVHLDFTEFAKLAPLARLWGSARLGLLRTAAVRSRIEAQLDAFEDATGRAPD